MGKFNFDEIEKQIGREEIEDSVVDIGEKADIRDEDDKQDFLQSLISAASKTPPGQLFKAAKFFTEEIQPRSEAVRVETLKNIAKPESLLAGPIGAASLPNVSEQLIKPTSKFGKDIFAPALESLGITDAVPTDDPLRIKGANFITPANLGGAAGKEIAERPSASLGLIAEVLTDPLNVLFSGAGKAAEVIGKEAGEVAAKTATKIPVPKPVNVKPFGERLKNLAVKIVGDFKPKDSILKTQERSQTIVKKVTDALKKAKPIRGSQEAAVTAERGRRLARAREIGTRTGGEAGFAQEKAALAGELPKKRFEAIREAFSEENITELYDIIKGTKHVDYAETITAREALAKALQGQVPTRGEMDILGRIFGDDMVSALRSQRSNLENAIDVIPELLGIPRAMMSSFDFSMPLRQGIFFATRPKEFFGAFPTMFRSFFSQQRFIDATADIIQRPSFDLMKKAKLSITSPSGSLTRQEEFFIGARLAEKLPVGIGKVIKASNRGAVAFLNKLRADVFDTVLKQSEKAGVAIDQHFLESLGGFINAATGRGSIIRASKNLGSLAASAEHAMVPLAQVLFSPRFVASRIQLVNPVFYARLHPAVRKEALKSLIGTAGLFGTVLGLATTAGMEVETDMRSSDFGKIRVGKNTRLDIMGGFSQIMVFLARMVTNETKGIKSGEVRGLSEGFKSGGRLDTVGRFLESKAAPTVSMGIRLLRGTNFVGDETTLTDELMNNFVPFVLQDLYDMIEDDELSPEEIAGLTGLATFGAGTQTFDVNRPRKKKDKSKGKKSDNDILKDLGFNQ